MEKHDLKPLYLTLAATTGAGVFFVPNATWPGASVMVAVCLLAAFLSRERIEDERVELLKLKAIRVALVFSALVVFLQAWAVKILNRHRAALHYLSAFDLLIIAMLIALGLYHYWRWQDGRTDRTG